MIEIDLCNSPPEKSASQKDRFIRVAKMLADENCGTDDATSLGCSILGTIINNFPPQHRQAVLIVMMRQLQAAINAANMAEAADKAGGHA